MPVKIKITKGRLKRIINATGDNYIKAAEVVIQRKVISEMKKGRSPVKGGRWDKPYSKSYKAAIRGLKTFRKINGKVVAMDRPDPGIFGFGKRLSPVNLKLSGKLHKSFQTKKRKFRLHMEFTDEIANFHHSLGAGKAKAIRRMFPSDRGEEFNGLIDKDLTKALFNSLKRAIKKNK